MVAFHGPMVAADLGRAPTGGLTGSGTAESGLDEESVRHLFDLLTGGGGVTVAVPQVVRPGRVQGVLLGGCLSLLAATAGTRYALRAEGTVLFLEDVGEPPYRIDRMLTQLRQSGLLEGVQGVVFGAMTDCGAANGHPPGIEMALGELAEGLGVPVGAGLPSGHGRPNLTLPFGLRVELALAETCGVLRSEEAAVV
jgi:muramoyltetrapeptide carboxypeptidase